MCSTLALAMSMLSSILWVLFCVCPTSIATVLVSRLYIANLVHDEKLFNEFLVLQRPSSSLVECASLCGPDCVYYGFNSKTKKCRIHSCSALVDAVEEADKCGLSNVWCVHESYHYNTNWIKKTINQRLRDQV